MILDSLKWINSQYDNGQKILLQGANAGLLDIDFGNYPYVTSSSCTAAGAASGAGLSPKKL